MRAGMFGHGYPVRVFLCVLSGLAACVYVLLLPNNGMVLFMEL